MPGMSKSGSKLSNWSGIGPIKLVKIEFSILVSITIGRLGRKPRTLCVAVFSASLRDRQRIIYIWHIRINIAGILNKSQSTVVKGNFLMLVCEKIIRESLCP